MIGNAQSLERLKAFTMSIHGTSTLHDWESKVTKATLISSLVIDENKIVASKAELKVLVKDIQSEHGRIMDGKPYEAFNADKYPAITFSLKNFSHIGEQATANGILTMNGTSKPAIVTMNSKILPNGDIQFIGSYSLKMTDFKMAPPTAMMGTIKVADDVTIKFDLTISR